MVEVVVVDLGAEPVVPLVEVDVVLVVVLVVLPVVVDAAVEVEEVIDVVVVVVEQEFSMHILLGASELSLPIGTCSYPKARVMLMSNSNWVIIVAFTTSTFALF